MQAKLLKYLTSLVLSSATVTATLTVFSQIAWAQNREGFYCDESGVDPILVSVTNGQSINLMTFSSERTPPPFTAQYRCQAVSARFQRTYLRGGYEAFDFAFGYLNNQPVMCIAAEQQGQQRKTCNPSKLLLTFPSELEACLFVPSFLGGLARQGVQDATSNLDLSQARQACNQQFANTGQRGRTQAERDTFVAFMNPDSSSPEPSANSVALNNVVLQEEGVLGSNTPVLDDGSHYQIHEFQGQVGQTVAIALESSAFDPYVLLWNSSNQRIGENDDASSEDLNSLLTIRLPYTGTYQVVANALDSSGQGRYQLTIRTDQAIAPRGAVPQTENPQATNGFILWKEATLDQNSPVLESDGSAYQTYDFQGRAGQSISIDLTSGAFDTYLILLNSSGEKIDENDDISNQSSNSSLTLTLPYTGAYRVVVNAQDRSGKGGYLLTVR